MFGSWRDITRFSLALAGRRWPGCRPRRSRACGRCSTSRCGRDRWRPVITSQLAGNALAKIAPGGGAMGAALQYKMLVRSGLPPGGDRDRADRGQRARVRGRARAARAGDPGAAARRRRSDACSTPRWSGWRSSPSPSSLGAVLLTTDRPLAWVGRAAQRVRNRLRRGAEPLQHLPERLLRERDRLRRHARPALEARAAGDRRALDVRLPDAARGARRDRLAPAPRARPAGVLRRPGAGPDPGHAGRAGLRRGRADRDARAGRRAAPATPCWRRSPTGCSRTGCRCRSGCSASRCSRARSVSGGSRVTAGAGRARARRPRAGARRRACGRCCAGGS